MTKKFDPFALFNEPVRPLYPMWFQSEETYAPAETSTPTVGQFTVTRGDESNKYVDTYTLDVPGFAREQLVVTVGEPDRMPTLHVTGKTADGTRQVDTTVTISGLAGLQKVSASLENGVLTVKVPREMPLDKRTRRVPIE